MTYFFLLMSIGLLISLPVYAQNRIIHISKTDSPPKIDGNLNDPVWQAENKYTGFVQFDPYNGQPATETTTVMLTHDTDHLYVAFDCSDTKASQIAAFLTPREQFDFETGERSDGNDNSSGNPRANDCVTLVLDTFNDKRTFYAFTVNPKGVQKDEPGDYLWQSGAAITSDGWQAELKIPFKSIRFSGEDIQTWGINFERYIFRLQETNYYNSVGRDDVYLEKIGQLIGLEKIKGGKNFEFFPYTGFRNSHSEDKSDRKFAIGLDAKYSITSDLNFDLTMSPDFSEVESDPFFYQLSPYEFELQERRPFFQEGNQYFPDEDDGPNLFYSKRIHNPRVAGKISGKQGKYTIAAVGAINKEENEDSYISVFSLQRDIFKYSKVATMFSGYSTENFQNFNGKINFDYKLSQILSWKSSVQFAYNSDIRNSQNKSYTTSLEYEPDDGWTNNLDFERTEKNFLPRAGIWRETDLQTFGIRPGYRFRLNRQGIKELELEAFARIEQAANGTPVGYSIRPLEVGFTTMKNFSFNVDMRFGRTKVQLEKDDLLYWDDQYFQNWEFDLKTSFEGSRYFQFNLTFESGKTPVYNEYFSEAYDGHQIESEFILAIRPTSTIKFNVGSGYTRQSRDKDSHILFEGAISELGFSWQLSRYLFFSSNMQHDSYDKRMKVDALLGIELGMGKLLSFSYKSRGEMPLKKAIMGDEASTLLFKASYLFRM